MFTAFFDEAVAATVYLVGGWIARDDEWARFTTAWNHVMAIEPAIRYFSYHDARGVQGQFTAWSNENVSARIDQLAKVICDHEMYGVVSGIRTTTWSKAFESKELSKRRLTGIFKFTHPYQACFFGGTAAVLQRQIEKGYDKETVNFVFDEQKGLLTDCIKHYEEFKANFPAEQKVIWSCPGFVDT